MVKVKEVRLTMMFTVTLLALHFVVGLALERCLVRVMGWWLSVLQRLETDDLFRYSPIGQ